MQLEKLVYPEYIHGAEFPENTVILRLNNGMEMACNNFRFHEGKLEVYVYKPFGKWIKTLLRNDYTKIIYEYYCKGKRPRKIDRNNYEQLMKHDRKRKRSTGGSRIFDGSITDYECSKNPIHDFRRNRYVQWNN